jgi:predicted acyltransferase
MIIVDDAGAFIPAMNHSPWDGVTVADFVMPFFLFIVGVALALAYKVVHARRQKRDRWRCLLCPPSFLKPLTVTSTTR